MKKILTMALLMLATMTVSAQTQDEAFANEVKKSIELQHMREMLTEMMDLQLKQVFGQNSELSSIPADKIEAISREVVDVMQPKLEQLMYKMYEENYTLEEMKQLNAYQATPLGQKSLKLAPKMSLAGAQVAQDPEVVSAIQAIVMKYLQ